MARRALILALVALTVAPAAGFKFMQNWKVPTLDRMASQKQAQDKFGDKKLVVITGTSSGLGRKTAKALLRTGQYHVVGAVRDLDKMEVVAEEDEFDPESFTPMQIELNNFTSVNDFVERLMLFKAAKPVDRLILNAGVSFSSPPPFPTLSPPAILAPVRASNSGREPTPPFPSLLPLLPTLPVSRMEALRGRFLRPCPLLDLQGDWPCASSGCCKGAVTVQCFEIQRRVVL
jgi:hypothetical protein